MNARLALKPKDIWLIRGNHCASNEVCKKVFGDKFRLIHECKINGTSCVLSHFPMLIWNKSHYGSYHLHGHLHDMRTDFWNEIPYLKDMKRLDVCPESYKRHFGEWGIFSEEQVDEILKVKAGHDPVEWYRKERGEL